MFALELSWCRIVIRYNFLWSNMKALVFSYLKESIEEIDNMQDYSKREEVKRQHANN